jgi:hypothetical protein
MPPVFKRVSDGQLRYRPSGVDTQVTDIVTRAATTVSTTGNIDNLDLTGYSELRMTNASDSTIRGIVAGVAGERKTIVSLGAGHVFIAHQDANSSAANRLINWVTSAKTPLAAGKGIAVIEYDASTARWRLIAHCQGADIVRTFSAGDFTAFGGGNTWTLQSGDITRDSYYLNGRYLTMNMYYGATTVGGAPTYLLVAIPNGFTCSTDVNATGLSVIDNNGPIEVGVFITNALGTSVLGCERISAAAWSVSTNLTFVRGSATFQVD